jgi:hypothetical protein
MNTGRNEDICIKYFLIFFNSVHFSWFKLTRLLLCIVLNIRNSEQLEFLIYLVWLLSYKLLYFVRAKNVMTYFENFRPLNFKNNKNEKC